MDADLDTDRMGPGRATAGTAPETPGFPVRPVGSTAKADVIPLGAVPDAEASRSLLLDLAARLDAGEDLGSRVDSIRKAVAVMRASVGGLRRLLEAPDGGLEANPELLALASEVLDLAEWNVAAAEEMRRRLPDRAS